MTKLEALNYVCGVMQIMGVILLIVSNFLPTYFLAIIAVAGFAGFIRMFLPVEGCQYLITILGSSASLGITISSISALLAIIT